MRPIASYSDLELLEGWRRGGDLNMGREFYYRFSPVVTRFFLRNVLDRSAVEDLVQETFLACSTASMSNVENVAGYVMKVAFHKFVRYLKSVARPEHQRHADEDIEKMNLIDLEPDPEYIHTQREEVRLLIKGLRRIPMKFQMVLELSVWEGRSSGEISAILNLPEGTVRSRLHHGRAILEQKIAELAGSKELLDMVTSVTLNTWRQAVHAEIDLGMPEVNK